MLFRYTATTECRLLCFVLWCLKSLQMVSGFSIQSLEYIKTIITIRTLIIPTIKHYVSRLLVIIICGTWLTSSPASAGAEKRMDALLFFSPGLQFTEQKERETNITLGFTGKGRYLIEVYTPEQYMFSECSPETEETNDIRGFTFNIARSGLTSLIIKLYSIHNIQPARGEQYLSSERPQFDCDLTAINNMSFTEHKKIAVMPKTAIGNNTCSTTLTEENFPVTLFEYFPINVDNPEITPKWFVPHQGEFKSALIYSDEKSDSALKQQLTQLSNIGRFTLYHQIGGDFGFASAFISGGSFYVDILHTQCRHLLTVNGHTPAFLAILQAPLSWLIKDELLKSTINSYSKALPSGQVPPEVRALYQTFKESQTLSASHRYNLCHAHKSGIFLKAASLLPRTHQKWLSHKKFLKHSGIPEQITTTYVSELAACSHTILKPELIITTSIVKEEKRHSEHQGSRNETKETEQVSTFIAGNTSSHDADISYSRTFPLQPPAGEKAFCVWDLIDQLTAFQPRRDSFPSNYSLTRDALSEGYEDLHQLHPTVDPSPFPPPELPKRLTCDPALGLPSGLMKDYTPLMALGQGSEAICFLVQASLPEAQQEPSKLYALRFEQNFQMPEDKEIRQVGLLEMAAFQHRWAVNVYTQRKVTPKLTIPRRKRKKSPTEPPAKQWYLQLQEFCPGGDLQNRIDEKGALEAYPLWATTVSLLDVIATFHSRRLVHRDLKPANVFIGSDGHIRVADYGMSKCITSSAMAMSLVGTPVYTGRLLSKALDDGPTQYNTYLMDHIALGATVYALATGEQFYNTPDITSLALCIQAQAEYYEHLSHRFKEARSTRSQGRGGETDPFTIAVKNMEAELKLRYQQQGLTYDLALNSLIARLLCSNLKAEITQETLLEYFEHPYIRKKPASPEPRKPALTKGLAKRQKPATYPTVYRPEILLSDKPELLRPTLVTPFVISRTRTLEKQMSEITGTGLEAISKKSAIQDTMQQVQWMGHCMSENYFFQPLPKNHNSWHHAYLLGRLIQIVHTAFKATQPGTVFTTAVAEMKSLGQRARHETVTIVSLIEALSTALGKRHVLGTLYNEILQDCTLYKASDRFIKAANELATCSFNLVPQSGSHQFNSHQRISILDKHCHIITEAKLTDTLPDEITDNIVLYEHPEGWEVFIPK